MGLETGTYISDLVATNPVGATDPKSQGDDHIRLLKSTIKATFPSITGAVTPTHTELNLLAGATVTGTGAFAKAASPTFTGTVGAAAITATGTITGNLFSGSGASLTALNASNIASGSLADARLSANVPLLNASNVFTATDQTIDVGGGGDARLKFNLGGVIKGYIGVAGSSSGVIAGSAIGDLGIRAQSGRILLSHDAGTTANHKFTSSNTTTTFNGVAVSDFARLSQNNVFTGTTQDITAGAAATAILRLAGNGGTPGSASFDIFQDGSAQAGLVQRANAPLFMYTNGTLRFTIDGSGNFDFKGGTVTTNNASASEVGKAGRPARSISSSDNTTAADMGKTIRLTGGSGQTFTLDGDPPTDARVTIINESGNNWSIAASGTLNHVGSTGTRTLATNSCMEMHHIGSGTWRTVLFSGTVT